MHRNFKGTAPNNVMWTNLANQVAGRQCKEGVASFSNAYLRSRKFLQGDGGYSQIVWMTENLKKMAVDVIPLKFRELIATEKDVTTIQELKNFLNEKRRHQENL
jgi:acetyl-CoA decarbonylase/synthase complex subunit beta